MTSKVLLISTTLVCTLATQVSNADRSDGERRGPPAEAVEACAATTESAHCTFEGRRGETIEGTCRSVRSGEIACVPQDHRRGSKRRPSDDDASSERL